MNVVPKWICNFTDFITQNVLEFVLLLFCLSQLVTDSAQET